VAKFHNLPFRSPPTTITGGKRYTFYPAYGFNAHGVPRVDRKGKVDTRTRVHTRDFGSCKLRSA